ncbi:hypothetical protein ACIBW9_35070 [Streptomyces sp. NPDC049541]|uniref:hypothetical protein n=1 Tax=Streptomyces sp. NPDC049541 TaxID=3365594 RepID=UPI003795F85E
MSSSASSLSCVEVRASEPVCQQRLFFVVEESGAEEVAEAGGDGVDGFAVAVEGDCP